MNEIEGSRVDCSLLTRDGYVYIRKKERNGTVYLNCHVKTCDCLAQWTPTGQKFTATVLHNHDPDPIAIELLKLKAELKNRVCRDRRPYQKVFNEVCAKYPKEAVDRLDLPLCLRSLRKHRSHCLTSLKRKHRQTLAKVALEVDNYDQEPTREMSPGLTLEEPSSSQQPEADTQMALADEERTPSIEENIETPSEEMALADEERTPSIEENIETPSEEITVTVDNEVCSHEEELTNKASLQESTLLDKTQSVTVQEKCLDMEHTSDLENSRQEASKQLEQNVLGSTCEPVVEVNKLKMTSKNKLGLKNIEIKQLKTVLRRLEIVSEQIAADFFGDSYDQFGKYIATLLRGLPRKTVISLKQQIVQAVLNIKFAQEQDGSIPDTSTRLHITPDGSDSLTTVDRTNVSSANSLLNNTKISSASQQHLKSSDTRTISTCSSLPSASSITATNHSHSKQSLRKSDSNSQSEVPNGSSILNSIGSSLPTTNDAIPQQVGVSESNSQSKEGSVTFAVTSNILTKDSGTIYTNCSFPQQTSTMPNSSIFTCVSSSSISASGTPLLNCPVPQHTLKTSISNYQSIVTNNSTCLPSSYCTTTASGTNTVSQPMSGINTLTCPTILLASPQLFTVNQQMVLASPYQMPIEPKFVVVGNISHESPVVSSSKKISTRRKRNKKCNSKKNFRQTNASNPLISPVVCSNNTMSTRSRRNIKNCSKTNFIQANTSDPFMDTDDDFPMDIEEGTELADMKRDLEISSEIVGCGYPPAKEDTEFVDMNKDQEDLSGPVFCGDPLAEEGTKCEDMNKDDGNASGTVFCGDPLAELKQEPPNEEEDQCMHENSPYHL